MLSTKLPPITLNQAVDYSQEALLPHLTGYYNSQSAKLPFDSGYGLCSGLVSYWLYSKAVGEEGKFFAKLEYCLKHNDPSDVKIEEFVNNVMFLQNDKHLRLAVKQDSLQSSFNLLLPDNYPQVNNAEFKTIAVFNQTLLEEFISSCVFNNKMVRIDNSLHTIGLIYNNDKYHLYDPNHKEGQQTFEQISELSKAIFAALARYCGSTDYIAIYFAVFDLENSTPAQYIDYNAKFSKLLSDDAEYKQHVLAHTNIFHLAQRYNDFELLDKLFAAGYTYNPWQITNTTEMEEAILDKDHIKLEYFIQHKIPLDYRTNNGYTPLARAVISNATEFLYLLLEAGADPNTMASTRYSLFNIVNIRKNSAALILLIAAGMKLSNSEFEMLTFDYDTSEIEAIAMHALLLHAKLNAQPHPSEGLITLLNNIMNTVTQDDIKHKTKVQKDEMEIILQTLQDVANVKSDVQESAITYRDKLAKYLNTTPPPALVFSPAKSFDADVAPLLSLSLKPQ